MQKLAFATKERSPVQPDGCCGQGAVSAGCSASAGEHWIIGTVDTPAGPAARVATKWTAADTWGMVRSRIGAFRMRYAVRPGLYAVGGPGKGSPVLVTGNYKLSFDIVRRALAGHDAWLLVLDTKSINVWCAAGKGTFGTGELVRQVREVRLDEVVEHRKLIVPQLGAVGVSASEIQRRTGFRVSFGPVDARDLPAYLDAGGKKTVEMSLVRFSWRDRLVLTPMELNPALKTYAWFALGLLLFFGLSPEGIVFRDAWTGGLPFLLFGLAAITAGAFLTPVLLPAIPFRSFALKGLVVGMPVQWLASAALVQRGPADPLLMAAAWMFFPAVSSYLALQFTGATTFTSMSGVKKELRIGLPLYIGAAAVSAVLLVVFKLRVWGVA